MKGMRITLTILVSLFLVGLAGAYPPGWKGPKTITKYGTGTPGVNLATDASIAVDGDAIYMVYYTCPMEAPYKWWFKRSTNHGLTWSDSLLIWDKQAASPYTWNRINAIAVSGGVIHVLMSGLGYNSGDQAGIFYRRSSDGGNNWWPVLSSPPLDIAVGTNYPGSSEHHPSIACLGNNVVAVWSGTSGQGPRVFSKYSTDGGLTWDPLAWRIVSAGDWYDYPNVLIKPGGTNYTFCFYSGGYQGITGVFYSVSSDFGNNWGNQRGIHATGAAIQVPSAALLPTGNVFVAWDGIDITPSYYRICHQLVNESGLVGDMGLVAPSSDPFHQRAPRVAVGPGDSVTVVWEDNRAGSPPNHYQIYASTGGVNPFTGEYVWEAVGQNSWVSEQANNPPVYDDLNPDIAFLSCSNSRVVVWDGLYNNPTDQSRQIWYHKRSADNIPQCAPGGLQVWEWWPCLYLEWNYPCDDFPPPSGYNVYRADITMPPPFWVKINPQPVPETYYLDCDIESWRCYDYYVKSLDCAENESDTSNHAYYWGCFGDGFQMAYVDAGTPAPSRNTQRRTGYFDWGGIPAKTVDYDPDRLVYHFEGLNPDSAYILKLGGYEEPGSRGRRYSVEFDGIRVLNKGKLPGSPARTAYLVPKAAYRDGAVDVSFIREKGSNVVVAELWLLRIHQLKKGGPQSGEPVDLNGAKACLYDPIPNPSSGAVGISYALSVPARVSLDIYNIAGQKVRILAGQEQSSGRYALSWDGKCDDGNPRPGGVYFCRLNVGDVVFTKRITLVR